MALGHQLVTQIFKEELTKTDVKHVKGVFTDARNYKIACRFYYHFSIKGLRYERALAQLHAEFDLSELRIAQLLMGDRDYLKKLNDEKPDAKTLQKRFPYFNWF